MQNKAVRYVVRSTAAAAGGIATAATSVAAVALAASIIFSPAGDDASSRLDGVRADLARAVQLNQITEEQAARFESKLAGRILGDA